MNNVDFVQNNNLQNGVVPTSLVSANLSTWNKYFFNVAIILLSVRTSDKSVHLVVDLMNHNHT